jgi:hypothetical protein
LHHVVHERIEVELLRDDPACGLVLIEILGTRQRRQGNRNGIFELIILDELRNIVEVLSLHLRRDQDVRNDEDADLAQDLDRLLVLLHISFLVEARERIRADGFDPENQISKADVMPLLQKFRVLADVIDPAVTRQLLLDARLLNRVGKLAGVVRIGECVVVAVVYVPCSLLCKSATISVMVRFR